MHEPLTPAQARRRADHRLRVALTLIFVGGAVLIVTSLWTAWWSVLLEFIGVTALWWWQGRADAADRARIDWHGPRR